MLFLFRCTSTEVKVVTGGAVAVTREEVEAGAVRATNAAAAEVATGAAAVKGAGADQRVIRKSAARAETEAGARVRIRTEEDRITNHQNLHSSRIQNHRQDLIKKLRMVGTKMVHLVMSRGRGLL